MNNKKCIVCGHLGMGDMYWMNGAVRFFATVYDEVVVITKTHNVDNTISMYKDDQTIKIYPVASDPKIENIINNFPNHIVITCGLSANKGAEDYPDSFYIDMNLDPIYRTKYFHHADNTESKVLMSKINEPFILLHESKSNSSIDLTQRFDIDQQLVLNIGKNVYPKDHRWYNIVQCFVDKPLYYYIDALQQAKELHLIESSLACLATHLDLSNVKNKYIYQSSPNFLKLGVFEKGYL